MNVLARFFAALSGFFEAKVSAKELAHRIDAIEAEQALLKSYLVQMRTDITKCKLIVGLNQLTDVTPTEV